MAQKTVRYLKLFWQLVKTDLVIFKQTITSEVINILICNGCLAFIFAYIFPLIGMEEKFGAFMVFSQLSGESYWRIWASTATLIADLEGNKTIDYDFTLPLPSWLIFVKIALFHAFKAIVFFLLSFPVIKLLLWNRINLAHFSIIKFGLILTVIGLFTGFFLIFLASFVKSVNDVNKVGIRILFPLWFFGGTTFSWQILYSYLSPALAYICLANPVLYMMEGVHAAALGPEGFLPYWLCVGLLLLVSALFGTIGIIKFKRRLDLV